MSPLILLAQQTSGRGTIEGTVTDADHLVIAGAAVDAVNNSTGEHRAAATDDRGFFRITELQVGSYEIHLHAPGFSIYTQRDVTLSVGQTARLSVALVPSEVKSTVTVTSALSPLDAAQTSETSVIDGERIEELPVQTRNALDFVLLAPGVSPSNNQSGSSIGGSLGTSGFSFGGLRGRSNNISIDGLDNNDEYEGSSRTELSPEIVSEFQIVNNGMSAEFGGASGGSINVVTRSGANKTHGDAFVFVQNGALNARPAIEEEAQKPELTRYRAGLANGGAIRKNKTFYYAAFEQEHQRSEEDSIIDRAVASALNRYLQLGADPKIATRVLNAGFSPTARAETEASAKVDTLLSSNSSLMFRYSFTNNREIGDAFHAGGLNDASAAGSSFTKDNAVVASIVSTLSPVSVNDLRFQVARRSATLRTSESLGPDIEIDGVLNFGRPYDGNGSRREDHLEATDTFSHTLGRHLLKAGGVVNRVNLNSYSPVGFGGVYVFPSMTAFGAGTPDFFLQTFGNPHTDYEVTSLGGFVQDHWAATPKVTVDFGVRYDFEHLPSRFNLDTNNVSPRIGVAYSPTSHWVLRGGLGIFYDRYTLANLNRAMEVDGRQAFQQVADAPLAAFLFRTNQGGPLLQPYAGIAPSVYRADPGLATPYSVQGSVGVERQLSTNMTLGLTYLNVRGIKLARTRNVNLPQLLSTNSAVAFRPFFSPQRLNETFDNIYNVENSASSSYRGVTLSFNRRLAQEFQFSANYTLSKTTDDASDFDEQPQNPYDLKAERALSRNDQRHRLAINGTFDLPIGDEDAAGAQQGLATKIFKNIEMAPIVTVQSGRPVDPLTGLDSNGSQAWPLPVRPAGFGRNTLATPANAAVNVRVLKFFPVGGHARLDLVGEFFNLLNRTNIVQISPYFGSNVMAMPGFGHPLAASNARQIQFSLDFEY